MKLSIQTNFPEVAAALANVQAEVARPATARALNAAVAQAKTNMSREIRAEFNLAAGYVRDRLRITRASVRSGRLNLSAELIGGDGKRRSANVIAFAAKETSRGVSVKIKKAGSRKTIAGAFIANKGRTVFAREGKKRLPIKPVRTVDVPQMFNTRKVNAAVIRTIEQRFPQIFERELAYALTQFNATR